MSPSLSSLVVRSQYHFLARSSTTKWHCKVSHDASCTGTRIDQRREYATAKNEIDLASIEQALGFAFSQRVLAAMGHRTGSRPAVGCSLATSSQVRESSGWYDGHDRKREHSHFRLPFLRYPFRVYTRAVQYDSSKPAVDARSKRVVSRRKVSGFANNRGGDPHHGQIEGRAFA